MVQNPPKGYHTITPQTIVEDAHATLAFIEEVLGASIEEVYEADGVVQHAQARIGDSLIMIATASGNFPAFPLMLNVYVDEVDATFVKAIEHGATPLREPTGQFYGDRTGGFLDDQGNQWWISTRIEDVSDDEIRRRMEEMGG